MDDFIVRRLLESKYVIDTSLMNASNGSDEAWDLYDIIQGKVVAAVNKLFGDVDVDDSGLDAKGSSSGNRTIIYTANDVGRFESGSYKGLNSKEWSQLESELMKTITIPTSDGEYDYNIKFDYVGRSLKVIISREII